MRKVQIPRTSSKKIPKDQNRESPLVAGVEDWALRVAWDLGLLFGFRDERWLKNQWTPRREQRRNEMARASSARCLRQRHSCRKSANSFAGARFAEGADRDELFGVLAGSVGVMKAEDPIVQEMLRAARAAMKNAYCKYSRFRVGAAVLTAKGRSSGDATSKMRPMA